MFGVLGGLSCLCFVLGFFCLFVLNIHFILFKNSKILAVEYLKETAIGPVLVYMINKENNENQCIQLRWQTRKNSINIHTSVSNEEEKSMHSSKCKQQPKTERQVFPQSSKCFLISHINHQLSALKISMLIWLKQDL